MITADADRLNGGMGATAAAEPAKTGEDFPGSPADVAARIERIPFCSWHVKTRLTVGIATFFEGFNLLSIAYVLPVLVPLWHLSPSETGALIGAGFIGGTISTFALGWIAERYGRKSAVVLATACYSVASLLCAFAWSFASLAVLRGLQGLGGGGEAPVAVTYISEIARAQGRGRFILLYEIIFPLGLVVAAIAGWWVVSYSYWQLMFVIGAAPALFVLVLQRRLPESPRWLALRGRYAEADAVVRLIERATEQATEKPLPGALSVNIAAPQKSFVRDLLGPVYRGRTLMAWALCFLCYLINFGIAGWLPTLYQSEFHLTVERSLGYSLVTSAAGILGTLACALLIDVVGRRGWFTGAFAAGALVLFWNAQNGTASPEYLMVSASLAYFFISTISIGVYLYLPEIFPTRLRARAVAIASVWSTVAGIVGPGTIGLLLNGWGLHGVFLALSAVGLLGAVIVGFFAVETRGRVLEEVSP
jgi:putative MFS transporter